HPSVEPAPDARPRPTCRAVNPRSGSTSLAAPARRPFGLVITAERASAYASSTTGSGVAKSLTAHRGLCNSRNGPSVALGRTVAVSESVMPPHLFADRPAAQPPGRATVDALITQTRRLRGDMDAVRRDAPGDGADPQGRWQRALFDLALHHLDDLDGH